VPFQQVVPLVNPCTGQAETATIAGIMWTHARSVVRAISMVTTSSGFEGERHRTIVGNGNTFKLSLNAMLANDGGDRIRFQFILVVDERTGAVRVQRGGAPTCVR
jgi:hypothetical protein